MLRIASVSFFLLFTAIADAQKLTDETALSLSRLPMHCITREYPNKLSQTIIDSSELLSPQQLHPAFYGCFDWHSSVHGHWSLAYLVNHAALTNKDSVVQVLMQNLSTENITREIAYFSKPHERSYERMYGWAWLLKLQQELDASKDHALQALATNLQPLTDTICKRYIDFLPKLIYPQRVGTHTSTAFGLNFAYDYALQSRNLALKTAIENAARRYFLKDKNCPLSWEPSGTDFLSPCLEEAVLMMRIMPEKYFMPWLQYFMPQLFNKNFTIEPGKVGDRADGHLVHLDGLNFSRAWCLQLLANKYPNQFGHLSKPAKAAFNFSYPKIFDGNYEGEHWLASFALYALNVFKNR